MAMVVIQRWRKSHQTTILISPKPFSEYHNYNKELGLGLKLIKEFHPCLDSWIDNEKILVALKLECSHFVKASQPYLLSIHRITPEK